MSQIHFGVMAAVRKVADTLTDEELSVIYPAALFGNIHSELLGYNKIVTLLTENNGMAMHSSTIDALSIIVDERLVK